jgi:aspartyl protease family protein
MLAMTLVASGLLARRVPMMRMLAWAVAWAALILGIYLLFSYLEPYLTAWQQGRRGGEVQMVSSSTPGAGTSSAGPPALDGTVRVPLGNDGHYWVNATVNGQSVRFLIDSGASITGISERTANQLGIVGDTGSPGMTLTTANGTILASRGIIPTMQVGAIGATDLPVAISPAFGEVNVLGMNFLGKLRGWRVENGTMILEGD